MPRQPAQDPTLSDQHVRDFATLVPRQIRASEQVPSGGTAPDRSETFAELAAMEPGLRATPDAADFRDQPFLTEQPSLGWRMLRGLVRFCIVFLIGVAATLVWQSEGDNAIALARSAASNWVPAWTLDWLPPPRVQSAISSASSTNPPPAPAARQDTAVPQPAAAAQMPAAAAMPPDSARQIETMARDLSGMRHSVEQLAARQEEMTQSIATLQAAEQELKQKIASLPKPAPAPKRKPPAPATPSSATTQSTAMPPPAASEPPVPRPPSPLH